MHRRHFLQSSLAASLLSSYAPKAYASTPAKRILFFYFPDGVIGRSENGDNSQWHASGSESNFSLGELTQALAPYQSQSIFINGLSLSQAGAASGHPEGAQRLLSGAKYGDNISIDQRIAQSQLTPWKHLYLGVQSKQKIVLPGHQLSYPIAQNAIPPEDDPRKAYCLLFLEGYNPSASCSANMAQKKQLLNQSMLELSALQRRLGGSEGQKIGQHLSSIDDLQQRISGLDATLSTCTPTGLQLDGLESGTINDPELFPELLQAQMDNMVLAMECGLSNVGIIQCSVHTSELLMNRFVDTPMYNPSSDIASHQASHYGANHDENNPYFVAFKQQRKWFVSQYTTLLDRLASRPEGDGTMLDHSIVVLMSEVSDGNTHSMDDIPIIITGGGAVGLRQGVLVEHEKAPHSDLWIALAHAMGTPLDRFGPEGRGILDGILV